MEAVKELERNYRKPAVPAVQPGDTVRVHQLIREGNKQRVQVFEGVVIRTHRPNELTAVITVRRIASGVGVEKTFLLHSPFVQKVEVIRRGKVRRNFLSYLRGRRGKSARLTEVGFDRAAVNAANDVKAEQPADDQADAEVTEIGEQSESLKDGEAETAMQEEVKEENREAAAEDTANDPDAADDEEQVEKVEPVVEKAEKPDERQPEEGVEPNPITGEK